MTIQTIVRVVDGDTVVVNLADVPDIFGMNLSIRLPGIDTPELSDKDVCVRGMAFKAKQQLTSFLANGTVIQLGEARRDKYFRLDADIFIDGISATQLMLATGLARTYTGGTRLPWTCVNIE